MFELIFQIQFYVIHAIAFFFETNTQVTNLLFSQDHINLAKDIVNIKVDNSLIANSTKLNKLTDEKVFEAWRC